MVALMKMEIDTTDSLAKARQARLKMQTLGKVAEISAQDRLSRVEPIRRPVVEDRLSQMPNLYRNTYLRAIGGHAPKAAIKSFCLECVGWQRSEVARCTALACPLWAYRPYRDE